MTAAIFDPPLPRTPVRLTLVPDTTADVGPEPTARSRRLPAEVYRRRRLAVVAAVVGLLLGVASFGRQADATPTGAARAADAVVVIVQPGDTLWGIAAALAPGADPRPLVAALSDLAEPSALQPGQELVIPGHLLG